MNADFDAGTDKGRGRRRRCKMDADADTAEDAVDNPLRLVESGV